MPIDIQLGEKMKKVEFKNGPDFPLTDCDYQGNLPKVTTKKLYVVGAHWMLLTSFLVLNKTLSKDISTSKKYLADNL